MKGLQGHTPRSVLSTRHPRLMILVAISACMLFAFLLGAWTGNLPLRANAASLAHASTDAPTASYSIKVFFSRFPDSLNDFSAVYPVDRTSPTIAVGTFSIQLLIAGPTLSERQAGYFSELSSILTGPSSCSAPYPTGGPDFTLTLNHRGPMPQTGTATVKFCRGTASPGIGTDGRVIAEINATLKQFPNIKQVVVLTQDGHCFGDESGKDLCLK